MSRAVWLGMLAAYSLTACDDGSLQAFQPTRLLLGGSAGRGSEAEAGAGRGGAAGASQAGAGAGADADASASPLLIDDFEDGDTRAMTPFGWWYPVNDGTSAQGFGIEPMSGGTTSVYALRTHGSGFRDWGSAVGVDLLGDGAPVDLQSYDELCFMGRVEAGSSTLMQAHFLRDGLHYRRDVSLSETWTRYCLPLTEFLNLNQEALVPSQLIALQFFFAPTDPFLVWLDDIEVVRN
jgi:hypothetical protein